MSLKIFKAADVRNYLDMILKEEASFSRVSQLMNEQMNNEIASKVAEILSRSLTLNRWNEYEIKYISGEYWITHKQVGSGEPLKQWIESEIKDKITATM